MRKYLFTSESVTEGHPDKMADQVSDAILDAILTHDKHARCAIETLFKTGICIVTGEISTTAWINIPNVVRNTIKNIGYTSSEQGFDGFTCGVLVAIEGQSKDIALGIKKLQNKKQGAGDQGMMFGYACNETKELMPMPIIYAHKLTRKLSEVRKKKIIPWLRPDGKSQVSVLYHNEKPIAIENIIISTQHMPNINIKTIKKEIIEEVIKTTIPKSMLSKSIKYYINPAGNFIIGGPMSDSGLTGRKIIIDTYGGAGRHGGGSFSGKDPSKVDRSAAYMSRYIAKNIVAAKIASKCEIQLSYAIGISEPTSVMVNTFNTSKISEEKIEKTIKEIFPLTPEEIINHLNLLRPIYQKTASYGHFGRKEKTFTWEKTDMVSLIKNKLL